MVQQEPDAAKRDDEAPMEEHHAEICKDDQEELDTVFVVHGVLSRPKGEPPRGRFNDHLNDDGVVSTDEIEHHHQVLRKSLEQEGEDGLKFFRGHFVLDYVNTICRDQRRQRLLVSFVGHILHIALYLTLLFVTTESARVTDLVGLSRVMAGTTSDEWVKMESLDDWYLWLQKRLLPSFYKQDWYTMRDGAGVIDTAFGNGTGTRECKADDTLCKVYIQRYNMIVGAMRIQQKRVTPSDMCNTSNTYRDGGVCYGYLFPENESKDSFVGASTSTTYSFNPEGSTTWWGSIPGQWASYTEGGYNADFVPNQTTAEWTDQLNTLKQDIWIGYPTRMVTITANGYNAGLDMFFNFVFLFEFSASGAIYKQIIPQAFTRGFIGIEMEASYNDSVRAICLALATWLTMHYFLNLIAYTIYDAYNYLAFEQWWDQTGRAAVKNKETDEDKSKEAASGLRECCSKGCWHVVKALVYFSDFWRLVDWALVCFEGAWIGMRIMITIKKDAFNVDLAGDGFVGRGLSLASMITTANKLLGAILFMLFFKTLKFLQISKRLSVMWNAIVISITMLWPFFGAFIFVFTGFALWGHVTFGSDVHAFATPILSINTAVDMLIGNGNLPALYAANRLLGPFYYFMFTIMMTLILINVFIAIMCEAYNQAKAESRLPAAFGDRLPTAFGDRVHRVEASAIQSYLTKLLMVLTFNMCFTKPHGLSVPLRRPWEEVGLGERIQLTLISTTCFLFNLLFLCRFTNTGEERHTREFQIYENKATIRLALEHLRTEAIELKYIKATNDDFSIREDVICTLFGDLDDIELCYDGWGGPEEERMDLDSIQYGIEEGVRGLAEELRVFERAVLSENGDSGEVDKACPALVELLETWKDRKIKFHVTPEHFPLEMMSLDEYYLAARAHGQRNKQQHRKMEIPSNE